MLELCLLGTGGTMPMPNRALTSLLIRLGGKSILVDCGEGTQVQIRKKKWSIKDISLILITHFHADHIAGLPGLLLSMGKDGRTENLNIIGPVGLQKVVEGLRVIIPELPFSIIYTEVNDSVLTYQFDMLKVEAFSVKHRIQCLGYSFNLERLPKFNLEKAMKLPIDKKYWKELQKGKTVTVDGITYNPRMVLGEERKGLHVTYTTDTRPTDSIAAYGKNSDLLICEGMYGSDEKTENALLYSHMTMSEAATLAKKMQVKELWFTHYSTSVEDPEKYTEEMKKIFPNTRIAKDLDSVLLKFED